MSMETVLFRVFRVNSTGICGDHTYDALVLVNDHWQTFSSHTFCRLGLLHLVKPLGPLLRNRAGHSRKRCPNGIPRHFPGQY